MAEITLVRHGQANSAARDPESYDRLSPLGAQQSTWLGEHFAATRAPFERILCGSLTRQRDTARLIASHTGHAVTEDPRLNEIAYFEMATTLARSHGLALPAAPADFTPHMTALLSAWRAGEIEGARESFPAFEARVRAVIAENAAQGERVLMVTSGGLVGMAVRIALDLEVPAMARVMARVPNSSLHQVARLDSDIALQVFAATPHLDHPERRHARTFI